MSFEAKIKTLTKQIKTRPVIVVFSFGAKLNFVFRYGQIVSVDKNENKPPPPPGCIHTFNQTCMQISTRVNNLMCK